MLYETLLQPIVFMVLAISGFASGFLFDAKNIFLCFFKKRAFWRHFFTFFAVFFAFFCFFYTNLKINYGEFRAFAVIAFWLAFAIERFFAQNFVAKPAALCYNKIKEKIDERNERKSKRKIAAKQNDTKQQNSQ